MQMLENHGCVCLIYRVERELILTLNQQASQTRFRKLATDFPALNAFTSAAKSMPMTTRIPAIQSVGKLFA